MAMTDIVFGLSPESCNMPPKKKTNFSGLDHQQLLLSLADHLRDSNKVILLEPNFSGWGCRLDCGIPDIYSMRKSYTKTDYHIYEVKASKSDLSSDLSKSKWERYLPISERVTFAVDASIDWKKYLWGLPVGIMVYKNSRWRTVRAAPRHKMKEDLPENFWLSLLFGRMSESHKDGEGGRRARLEAERAILAKQDLNSLICSANEFLSKKARELRLMDLNIEDKRKDLDNKLKSLEVTARHDALNKIATLLKADSWYVKDEKDVLSSAFRTVISDTAKNMERVVKENIEQLSREMSSSPKELSN